MVRAILEGRKTQTRRVVKLPRWAQECNEDNDFELDGTPEWPHAISRKTGCLSPIECPYGVPGDRLWVKEKFSISGNGYFYSEDADGTVKIKWTSGRFMPRAASRITLQVSGVRVDRLQEISEQDAMVEGVNWQDHAGLARKTARKLFIKLWNSINGTAGKRWSDNPWVWVIEFRMAE